MAKFRPNVAALLVDERGQLLICERYRLPGAWQFPQGGVDKGESKLEALRREVREEVSLEPDCYEVERQQGGYRYIYPPRIKKRKRGQIYDGQEQTYFLCRLKPGDLEINIEAEPREFGRYRWIWPEEFQRDWLPDFKLEVYQGVFRDFFGVEL